MAVRDGERQRGSEATCNSLASLFATIFSGPSLNVAHPCQGETSPVVDQLPVSASSDYGDDLNS